MDAVKTLNYIHFMKRLEEQMSSYAAYHRDARNRATHFIGVPAIMLSLFIPLPGAVLVYCFVLDVPLALAMLLVTALLVWAGHRIAELGTLPG